MTIDEMCDLIHQYFPLDARTEECIGEPIIAALRAAQKMRNYFHDSHDEDCPQAVWDWDAAVGENNVD